MPVNINAINIITLKLYGNMLLANFATLNISVYATLLLCIVLACRTKQQKEKFFWIIGAWGRQENPPGYWSCSKAEQFEKSYCWSVWCFITNWADPSVSLWSPPSSNFFLWIMLKQNFCWDFFPPRKVIAGLRITQHSKQIISTVQEMRQSAGHSCMAMTAKEGTTKV